MKTELTIGTDIPGDNPAAWAAYCYACDVNDVSDARCPEVEPTIMQDAEISALYARDVIKGRWREAEPVIAQNANAAHGYAYIFDLPLDPAKWAAVID